MRAGERDRQAGGYEQGHGERRDRGVDTRHEQVSDQTPLICQSSAACCAVTHPGAFIFFCLVWPWFSSKLSHIHTQALIQNTVCVCGCNVSNVILYLL